MSGSPNSLTEHKEGINDFEIAKSARQELEKQTNWEDFKAFCWTLSMFQLLSWLVGQLFLIIIVVLSRRVFWITLLVRYLLGDCKKNIALYLKSSVVTCLKRSRGKCWYLRRGSKSNTWSSPYIVDWTYKFFSCWNCSLSVFVFLGVRNSFASVSISTNWLFLLQAATFK